MDRVHVRRGVVLAACALWFASSVTADTDVSITGQVRARTELDKRNLAPNAIGQHYTDLRTRVNVSATTGTNTQAFVQFQDSRRLGSLNSTGSPQSGSLNDGDGVDVHQAYVKIDRLWNRGLGLRAGRFEVNLGNQRVFGAVGWHNVGRAWEGISAWLPTKTVRAEAFWLKGLELNNSVENLDFDVIGLNAVFTKIGVEAFVFHERDAATVGPDSLGMSANTLGRTDVGVYAKRGYDQIDIEINGVVQVGNQASSVEGLVVEEDVSAFLATAEVGLRIPASRPARVAVGIDFASGDDDPTDDTNETYQNLYYTGHKFRGFMDYFLGSHRAGLIDVVLRGKASPAEGWTVMGDVHFFQTAVEYVDFEGSDTRSVGVEVDLGVKTTRIAGVTMQTGASLFLPSDAFAGTSETDPGLWAYSMLTANFGQK